MVIIKSLLRLRTFEALRYREYRLLWFGQVFVSMGTWMDEVTRGWLIYELTNSAVQLGLVRGIQAIPFLLLSPIAGSAADRYSRKTQLVLAQVVNGVGLCRDSAADFFGPDPAVACLRHRLFDGIRPGLSAAGTGLDGL